MARSNSLLYQWLNPVLYDRNIKRGGSSALYWAAAGGRESTIKLTITFGVDLEYNRNPDSIPYISSLMKGNNIYYSERSGTAFHIAIKYGHLNMMYLLRKHTLDISHPSILEFCHEVTPMELAIMHGQPSCAIFVLDNGYDINVPDEIDWTPLKQAITAGTLDDLNGERILMTEEYYKNRMLMCQIALQYGADVNYAASDPEYETPQALELLFDTAEVGNAAHTSMLLQLFFDKGADINLQMETLHNSTPLISQAY